MAKISDTISNLFSVPSQATQQIEKVTESLEDAKSAAVNYAAITLVLQLVSTVSVAVVAYCAYQSFCNKNK